MNGISTNEQVATLVDNQKRFFKTGATLDVRTRKKYLVALHKAIENSLDDIHGAIKLDLGKSARESYMCETGLVLSELSFMIKHVKRLSKPRRVKTPLANFAAKSYRLPSPYGTVLVMNPWNYPFLLALGPLADAVAAGNTVVLKTSSQAPNTGEAIRRIIEKVFPPEYVTAIPGSDTFNEQLLDLKFDYIFFTGSKRIGTLLYKKASETLTPVTLELGGKSPCIVDETANIKLAAKRIVWGKYLNLGQTCVAPDYVLCAEKVHDRFVAEVKSQIVGQYGVNPLEDPDYGKIINRKHFDRIIGLIDKNKLVHGGGSDDETLKIEPTVLDNVAFDDRIMQDEIFGPIMPIITYKTESDIVDYISSHDAPLAFYIFSSNKKRIKRLTRILGFGGGCVNDTVMHLATPHMPFGGFGASGIGSYHGEEGFKTFSHIKSIADKKTFIDMPMRYRPGKKIYDKIVKLFLH